MPYKKKHGKKDIELLEQVIKFLQREERKAINNMDAVRKNEIENHIVALIKVLHK